MYTRVRYSSRAAGEYNKYIGGILHKHVSSLFGGCTSASYHTNTYHRLLSGCHSKFPGAPYQHKHTILRDQVNTHDPHRDSREAFRGLIPWQTCICIVSNQKDTYTSTLQVMLEDSLSAFRDSLRSDLQNLHLDMIRQFHLQQQHFEGIGALQHA